MRRIIPCALILAALSSIASASLSSAADRAVRRSDVVFMYDNPSLYETYGCTVLGWAGRADKEHIQAAHAAGVRVFATSVGFRTEFRGMIDFSEDFMDAACRNFAGEPFIVPWLWDHKHKGQPAWHWCTNSPLYREFLVSRLVQRMAAEPDGLHIDDYTGTSGMVTWQAACFCEHCTAGFRAYLAENVPSEKLAELGIEDVSKLDYRQFLLDLGVTAEDYKRRRSGLPLAAEFLDFQVKSAHQWVAEYRRQAEEIRGGPLTLSVNSGLSQPLTLTIAPQLSYFCCEVGHAAPSRKVPTHPIYVYKLADGLDRPVCSTAGGHDWAYASEHNLPGLVRTWIALSYAHGHTFMAPHRQWCYTQEKGTHWYAGPTEEYAWPYQFVRQHAKLLDGYEAVAPVAVVYDNAARRLGRGNIEPICAALAGRNVPFTVVVAGDDWLDYRLSREQLAGFRAVIVAKAPAVSRAVIVAMDPAMDREQRKLLDEVAAAGNLVTWPDDAALNELVPSPVIVEGSDQVGVVPRAVPGDAAAPVAVHLLNREYDGQSGAMVPQRDFTIRLRRDLFPGRDFATATLHAPKAEPRKLELRTEAEYIHLQVPQLDLWGIVELD